MLTSLPVTYLLLMAAAATSVFCFAMTKWFPGRQGKVVFPLMSIGCCLGMILVGQLEPAHWSPKHMLVLYSFGWFGLTLGMFPSRKLMHMYMTEINQGVRREKYPVPVRYQLAAIISVVVMTFLAHGLS
ncbi:hypothetical protein ACSNOH_11640 [Streptomyces sp. URMC 127]|uniref:hypothetical protein n=1 Tax=Streptomyces sp. URMC 127 TaxID=3423402 RepID=UPI003F1CB3EF